MNPCLELYLSAGLEWYFIRILATKLFDTCELIILLDNGSVVSLFFSMSGQYLTKLLLSEIETKKMQILKTLLFYLPQLSINDGFSESTR